MNKKEITKIEVKELIRNLDFSEYKYIGFVVIDKKIKIQYSNEFKDITHCLNSYLKQWRDKEYTLKETVNRVQEYMCDTISNRPTRY